MRKGLNHNLEHSLGFRKGIFFTSTGTIVSIIFLFLEMMFVVRWLNTESYGIYILLLAVVNFLVITVDFGLKTAVSQLIASSSSDPIRQAALVSNALFFRLATIVFLSLTIWLAQSIFVIFLYKPLPLLQYAYYFPLMLLAASADELLGGMLRGFQSYHHLVFAQIVRSVLRLGLTVIFLTIFDLGILALVFSWILSFSVAIVYQCWALPIKHAWVYQRSLLGELLKFGFPLYLSSFLWFAFGSLRVFLLGLLAGPISVAYYAVASKIPDTLSRLSDSFISVYFPTMAALISKGEQGRASWVLDKSLRLTSFAIGLIALSVVVFSQEIVILLFSTEYENTTLALIVLVMVFHMLFLVNLMGYTLTAAGYPGRSLTENVVRTTLTVLGCLLLIPSYGFIGAAYAALVAVCIANPIAVLLLRRSGITVDVIPYAKQTALLLLGISSFLWLQPISFIYKVVIILMYLLLSLALATVSIKDLYLVLPNTLSKRLTTPPVSKNRS